MGVESILGEGEVGVAGCFDHGVGNVGNEAKCGRGLKELLGNARHAIHGASLVR